MVDGKFRHGVLLVTRNFPPLVGGMERVVRHGYEALVPDYDVALVGPAGCEMYAPSSRVVVGIETRPTSLFLFKTALAARRLSASFQPHLVFAGSALLGPAVIGAAKRANALSACYVHGLDVVYRNVFYQQFFVSALKRMNIVIANSANTAQLARSVGVDPKRIEVLHPCTSIPEQRPDPSAFREKYSLGEGRLLLSVGRLTARKGLVEFVRDVMPKLIVAMPDLRLAIIGEDPANAARQEAGQKERLIRVVGECGLKAFVRLIGGVSDEVLAQAYAASDLLVLPARDLPGDVEGFGMVAIEAAAHGLPTAAYASGGVMDAIAVGVSGYLVPAGDNQALAERIHAHLSGGAGSVSAANCLKFAQGFSKESFARRLCSILNDRLLPKYDSSPGVPQPS